ncbi:MAG TPA: DUF2007 domain-containing protein [Candidatus Binatia bacterium]|nr:DUF2007 domain-containing protein [Candidatus Binatia bacterium]
MKLVTVYRTFSSADAQLIRSLLEAAEIPALVSDELASLSMEGYSMSTGGIRVQVPEEQVENARELIENKAADAEG